MDEYLQEDKKNKIKLWIHKELKLDNTCLILLSEIDCKKDFVDKETIVIVMKDCEGGYAKVFRLKQCISEITEDNVCNLLQDNIAFEKDHYLQPCSRLIKKLL